MKITLIELNLQCSTVTYQSALTLISDFFLSSEVMTTWQTDSVAYKLKPRSFHKSAHLWVHSVDFHPSVNCAWQDAEVRTAHYNKLKNIFKGSCQNNDTILVISDTSVKNDIVISVSHIRREHEIIKKTIHHAMNVISTRAEIFVIRCGIS